jgi:hypothetical protein
LGVLSEGGKGVAGKEETQATSGLEAWALLGSGLLGEDSNL